MTATDNHAPPATILVIDIGGSQVKILATGETDSRTCRSGKRFTPTQMVAAVQALAEGWTYEALSIGYPGVRAPSKSRAPVTVSGLTSTRTMFAQRALGLPAEHKSGRGRPKASTPDQPIENEPVERSTRHTRSWTASTQAPRPGRWWSASSPC